MKNTETAQASYHHRHRHECTGCVHGTDVDSLRKNRGYLYQGDSSTFR